MGNQLIGKRFNSTPGIPAWLTSALVHGGLFLVLWIVLQRSPPPGAVAEPMREAGIVLKKVTDDGPLFQGEQIQPSAEAFDANSTTSNMLPPSQASTRRSSDTKETSLPEEPGFEPFPSTAELASTRLAIRENLPTANLPGPAGLPSGDVGYATERMAGGAPSKRVGGEARVRLFGVEGTGTRFVYLFDRSVSMEGRLLAAAKSQLIASLESLESVHQFQILFFNTQVHTWDITGGQNRIPFATSRNRQLASQFVRGTMAAGGTLRREALRRALVLRPDVVFFLTDTDNPMAADDVARAIELANRNGTAIHAIEFGFQVNPGGDNFLVQLARSTGGQYVYVDTAKLGLTDRVGRP